MFTLKIVIGLIILTLLFELGSYLNIISSHTKEERIEILGKAKFIMDQHPEFFYFALFIILIPICFLAYYLGEAFLNTVKAF